jgi:hypothetical protein
MDAKKLYNKLLEKLPDEVTSDSDSGLDAIKKYNLLRTAVMVSTPDIMIDNIPEDSPQAYISYLDY